MVENENIDNTNSNDQGTGGRRRRSIFGGRRVSRPAGTAETPVFAEEREVAAEQVAVEQAPAEQAPEESVADAAADAPDPTIAVTEEASSAPSEASRRSVTSSSIAGEPPHHIVIFSSEIAWAIPSGS